MVDILEKKAASCYHCGLSCNSVLVVSREKSFCCDGCKTVYEILNENELCDYYSLGSNPGNTIENNKNKGFDFLKDEKISDKLLNFKEGKNSGITFYIPTIHCSSCIWLLENLKKIQPGIIRSVIVFRKKELEIQFDNSIVSVADLAFLLEKLGYAPEITLEGKLINKNSAGKTLIVKIGIAGFCFGNIMMLSIPEYVSFLNDFDESFKLLFSYLSLLLSLPVFFYCASDYFFSAWNALKNKIINIDFPIAIAILTAFSQSIYEIISQSGMGYLDSLTGLIFFLLIGKWYQKKTYESISFQRDYKSYFPLAATVVENDLERYVSLNDLNAGDVILLRNHDVIPADGILLIGNGRIDYSFVTGESIPVHKKTGESVFAGGRQTGECIQVKITRKVSESYLTQLWNKNRSSKKETSNLIDFTDAVGKYFTFAVIILAFSTYSFWYINDSEIALKAMVSVLIIFCPCTLALAIPFCFGNAMNKLSKNGLYLKNTETIEKLADNNTIIFDKTGTITCAGSSDITFEGYLSKEEKGYVKSLCKNSSHPLSKMLAVYFAGEENFEILNFKEEISKGICGNVHGHQIQIGSASHTGVEFAVSNGKTTLVYINIDRKIKGCFSFKNKYRTGIATMFNRLRNSYSLHLLSGDNDSEKNTLKEFFPENQLYFNQSPLDKLNYVKDLESNNKTIMIGDGLNDAGALIESNCGISVSEENTNFSPACNAILEAKKINMLPNFLQYSKACVKTVRISLIISLTYNIAGLFFACQGILKPLTAAILMPMNSVSIVVFVTVMSNFYANKYGLNEKTMI